MKFPRPRPVGGWLKSSFVGLIVLAVLVVLLLWRLGTLTHGFSPAESTAIRGSHSIGQVMDNPVNPLQRLIQFGFQAAGKHGAFWMRFASVITAFFFAYCFYVVSRRWFGRFCGMMGSVLFISMPWFILSARSAQPIIMMLSPLAVLAAYEWFKRSERPLLPWLIIVLAAILCIYSPGGFWVILAAGVVARRSFPTYAERLGSKGLTTGFTIGFMLLLPLIWALYRNLGIWHDFLLIPSKWQAPLTVLKSIVWSALALVWRAPYHIDILLGRLPIMSITMVILSFFGIYILYVRARNQLYGLLALIGGNVLFSGINHNLYILTLCLPALGLIPAAGLRYLYGEWRTVFPLNPLPKALALVLITLLVGLNLLLGARYALTAWPNTIATESTYVLK